MSETPESPEGTVEAGVDAAAIALTLGSASRMEADAFLRKQSALVDVQRHHLIKQFSLALWEKRMGVFLRLATAAIGLAIAGGLGFMVWDAGQSNNLLVEPFSVPPGLAERGLTGQVIAARVLDRLQAMQNATSSQRLPQSYANSWAAQDIKMEIPEAGVSLSELDRFLREKLGHDTHLSGDVASGAGGLTVTARVGADGADSVTGPESDLDGLVQKLAESVYRITQPYRYSVYLSAHNRRAEALTAVNALLAAAPRDEQPWLYNMRGWLASDQGGPETTGYFWHKALSVNPDFPLSRSNLMRHENFLSHPDMAIAEAATLGRVVPKYGKAFIRPEYIGTFGEESRAMTAEQRGDFRDAVARYAAVARSGIPGRMGLSSQLAQAQANQHDIAAARATLADPIPDAGLGPLVGAMALAQARLTVESQRQDWAGVMSAYRATDRLVRIYPGAPGWFSPTLVPLVAVAQARMGQFAAADIAVAKTPLDCYRCLIARAWVAELAHQPARADFWFARAIAAAPSIPFAEAEWGSALLERGQPDAAMTQFKLANQKARISPIRWKAGARR